MLVFDSSQTKLTNLFLVYFSIPGRNITAKEMRNTAPIDPFTPQIIDILEEIGDSKMLFCESFFISPHKFVDI